MCAERRDGRDVNTERGREVPDWLEVYFNARLSRPGCGKVPDTHHLPGSGVVLEQGVCELHWHSLLVVRVLILRDAEEHSCGVSSWGRRRIRIFSAMHDNSVQWSVLNRTRERGRVSVGSLKAVLPMPSLLECSSSISGADAPSLSMSSADGLSRASSHRTPAATRFTLSTGEYRSWRGNVGFV